MEDRQDACPTLYPALKHSTFGIPRATLATMIRAAIVVALLSANLCFSAESSSSVPDTNYLNFGFTGPETYPIDNLISQLKAADLNGDGLKDLVIVNNSRSKISLLYNQTGKTNAAEKVKRVRRELNELPPDARFRIESIASEKRIAAMVVADLNSDKQPDIAYYGDPKELVVQYNEGTNNWSPLKRWPIDDGQLTQNALSAGDLNGDGSTDLVLLAENHLYWLAQTADKLLAEPEKIPFSGQVKSVQVLDINGDARDDLLLVNWENPQPFRFRLQTAAGQLGPELYFDMPPIRSYWPDDLNADRKTEIVTIAMNSGRAQISGFVRKSSETLFGEFRGGQFQVLPLTKTSKARRGAAWADIDGDGLADLLVAEPDSGQLSLFLQRKDGALGQGRVFATLTGVTELNVVPADSKDRPAEIFLLSPDERQIGLTRYAADGRIPFPTIIPVEGRPLAMSLGGAKKGEPPALAVLLDDDGRRSLYVRELDGDSRTHKLSESFKSTPSSVIWHDADQDGLTDLVVLIPYEKMKILRQLSEGDFEELDIAPPGGTLEQPWVSVADVDGDGKSELLVAQKNFLRAVTLTRKDSGERTNMWSLTVREQINGAASNSRIVAATALRNRTNAIPSLFLLDAERKSLTLCERNTNGTWQIARNILLPYAEFTQLQPIALGGQQLNSIACLGANAVAWLPLGQDQSAQEVWELADLDGYETPIKDGQLHDVISGDLNGDGRKDLVFLETARNHLDIVIFDKDQKLVPATRWQVFEQRSFRGRQGDQAEPREALIDDVTGDGRNDLVVVVHDRILVYPQEEPELVKQVK
jgi:hypothetical protein